MDVILPAWEAFRGYAGRGPEGGTSGEDGSTNSLTEDQKQAFRGRLITFIKILQEVLENLDMKSNNASGSQPIRPESKVLVSNGGNATMDVENATEAAEDSSIETEPSSPSQQEKKKVCDEGENKSSLPSVTEVDPNLVQIKATKSEIEKRIAAFIERKQQEVDEMNRREFCTVFSMTSDGQSEETCARTDAVFVPRAGSNSHVKVSRVVNVEGPQTNPGFNVNSPSRRRLAEVKSESADSTIFVDERVKNIEQHLNIQQGPSSSKDMFTRLRDMENRILHLESLSPEYFNYGPPPPKLKPHHQTGVSHYTLKTGEGTQKFKDLTVEEIDMKMKALKDKLLSESG